MTNKKHNLITQISAILLSLALVFTLANASTITQISGTDQISSSRTTINTNFNNLNTDKVELAGDLGGATGTPRLVISGMNVGALIVASTTARVYAFPTSTVTGYVLKATDTAPWISWEVDAGGTSGITAAATTTAGINVATSSNTITLSLRSLLATISGLASTTGNLILGNAASGWNALSVGSDGQFLRASSTATNGVAWETITTSTAGVNFSSSGGISLRSLLATISGLASTTGNLIVGSSANGWAALGIGSNGQVLTASSTATNGVSWEAAAAGSGGGSTYNTIEFALNPSGAATPTSSPAGSNKKIGTNWTLNVLDYDGSTQESAFWTHKLPYFTALNICTWNFDAFATTITTASSSVWGISFRPVDTGTSIDGGTASTTVSTTISFTVADRFYHASTTIATSSIPSGAITQFLVARRPTESDDTMTSDGRYAAGSVVCTYR